MTEQEEGCYVQGHRAAWLSMLQTCLRELGYASAEVQRVSWVNEREQAIAALRSVCANHGDNDWPNELHLADVISKHLEDHLEE